MALEKRRKIPSPMSFSMKGLLFFFIANGIEDMQVNTGRRKALLLSVIESKTYGLVSDLLAPNRPTNKSNSAIVEVLKNHFQLKLSEAIQRHRFYTSAKQTLWQTSNVYRETTTLVGYEIELCEE